MSHENQIHGSNLFGIFSFYITLSFAEQFINVMTILSLLEISKLTVLLEEVRLPVAGYVYLGIALKNHAPVLFQSCRKRISILYYTWITQNRNNQRVVTAIIILTLTLWPLRVKWYLISPYNITPESHINIRRKRKWSPTKEGLDCKTNSPFHHLRTSTEDSMENINTLMFRCKEFIQGELSVTLAWWHLNMADSNLSKGNSHIKVTYHGSEKNLIQDSLKKSRSSTNC